MKKSFAKRVRDRLREFANVVIVESIEKIYEYVDDESPEENRTIGIY